MKRVLLIACAVMLAGCLTPEQIDQKRRASINDMVFVKHANGLCFAVTSSPTYAGWQVASVTNIPCQSGDTVFVR
jgi:starvation-inducible outer membrane lipoprotein